MLSSIVERPLGRVNGKGIVEKVENLEGMKAFEQDMVAYIAEHERVIKENVQLVYDRHSEVVRKQKDLEKKK